MKEISEAVLEKVKLEAREIVQHAEEEASREVENARRLRQERIEAEKKRLLSEAGTEAARIVAQGVMEARNKVAAAKAAVIDDIVARAKKGLREEPVKADCLSHLIEDAIGGLGRPGKVTVGVAAKDIPMARELVAGNEKIRDLVSEVVERPLEGGAMIENETGSLVVDNSHSARLDMLMPRILTRFGEDLF